MGVSIELATAFERAVGERLLSAERLVLSLLPLYQGLLVECDLAYRTSTGFFAVVVRLSANEDCSEARSRFQFWCARAGGIGTTLSSQTDVERSIFDARLERCDLKMRGVTPPLLSEALDRLVTDAGAPANRPREVNSCPTLVMDVGGQGWQGVRYDGTQQTLFIPGNIAPPTGDEIAMALRIPGTEEPIEAMARVSEIRSPDESGPGMPAGFTLRLESPPAVLTAALEQAQPPAPGVSGVLRFAPRYAAKAPVKVIVPSAPEPEANVPKVEEPTVAATVPLARIEYTTDQELAADYIANLSQGGAFVRTSQPPAVGSQVMLELLLPGGMKLKAPANVVFTNETGMGVKFQLDSAGNDILSTVIARISARPRRALVVDDDSVIRRMLAKALRARGFEVLTADDGSTGLQIVTEELLTLDLLITDINMPNMDGETFIRTIRHAGGESELAIVAITGSLQPGLETRLEKAGADAVLDKTLGPKLIAQAVDGVFERKRLKG